MITDKQIEEAFKGTKFWTHDSLENRKEMLAIAVFKLVCGYRTGHTMACVLTELGMTTENYRMPIKAAKVWAYHVCFSTG